MKRKRLTKEQRFAAAQSKLDRALKKLKNKLSPEDVEKLQKITGYKIK